jgi:hypothetical protein
VIGIGGGGEGEGEGEGEFLCLADEAPEESEMRCLQISESRGRK